MQRPGNDIENENSHDPKKTLLPLTNDEHCKLKDVSHCFIGMGTIVCCSGVPLAASSPSMCRLFAGVMVMASGLALVVIGTKRDKDDHSKYHFSESMNKIKRSTNLFVSKITCKKTDETTNSEKTKQPFSPSMTRR